MGPANLSTQLSRRRVLAAAGSLAGAAALGAGAFAGARALAGAGAGTDPEQLRALVLRVSPPHVGYAEATGRLGLPEIPRLERVTALVTGTTRLRSYVASVDRMRVDELTPAGERDLYVVDGREYQWDFGLDQLVVVTGETPVRLPRPADLTPPELGRRLARRTAADPVTALPGRRIAGRSAGGFRVTPADADTTIGWVDIWADPESGLVLQVEVGARGQELPLLTTAFGEVSLGPPDERTLTPAPPRGAAIVYSAAADLAGALRQLDAAPPPARLAGRELVPLADPGLPGIGVYGAGLSGFVLVPASRGIADRVIEGAASAGGVPVEVPTGRAARVSTPLLTVVARSARRGVLLAGTVVPEVLERAARELPAGRRA